MGLVWPAGCAVLTSRLVALDTIREPADRVELFVHPCQLVSGEFHLAADSETKYTAPAAYEPLELAGRVAGPTDATGAYHVCLPLRTRTIKTIVSALWVTPLCCRAIGTA